MKYLIQRLDKTIKSFTSFTRYSLIILILLTMSCTDKKQITEPIVIEPIIEEVIEPEPVIASYDKGLDLILINSNFELWYEDILLKRNCPSAGVFSASSLDYMAIYWQSNNNTYYKATMYKTNNIIYTLDTNQQDDKIFLPYLREYFSDKQMNETKEFLISSSLIATNFSKSKLYYTGSISDYKRVYIDIVNNIQYLKNLEPILYENDSLTPIIIIDDTYKMTPWTNIIYTNNLNQKFIMEDTDYADSTPFFLEITN